MHYSVTGFMELTVNGEKVILPKAVIKELHRQENIQWGRNLLENYGALICKPFDEVTDEEFEKLAITLESKMMSDNGDIEMAAIAEVFATCV